MDDDKRLKKKKKSSSSNVAIYLSLGIEMAVLLSVWVGIALDSCVGWKVPIFTPLMAFIGMFAAIWILLKILKNKN